MLEPRSRLLYLDALRPPPGYRLDRAIGTTYSVDLLNLLTVPLAFARLDVADEPDDLVADPVRLLRSLREYSSRVTLFCQAGRIAAPARRHALFAHLEPMLVEAQAPGKGEFHAKTWLLRLTASSKEPVKYRFLCLSRNLTADPSWDTVVALEGEVVPRQTAIAKNRPLAEFVESLPRFARRAVQPALREDLARLASEVRRVRFDLPESFDDYGFLPLHGRKKGLPIDLDDARRLLVVSPFLSRGIVGDLARDVPCVLVSRQESLDEVGGSVVSKCEKAFVLDDAAEPQGEVGTSSLEPGGWEAAPSNHNPRGLHAKLFVVDRGWDSEVYTGSANATAAAFRDNVEFLVRLVGKKSKIGVESFLREDATGKELLFRNLLQEYRPPEGKSGADAERKANEEAVEATRRALARADLRLEAKPSAATGLFDLEVVLAGDVVPADGVRARCWPTGYRIPEGWNLDGLIEKRRLTFSNLAVTQLTAFLCVEIEAGEGARACATRFALCLPLSGAPEDRLDQVLAGVLEEPGRFARFLLFLLADEEADAPGAMELLAEGAAGHSSARAAPGAVPLFEDLLRALVRAPDRLRDVQGLVEDLRRSLAGQKVLPDGFDLVWAPIWQACGGAS